MKYVIRNVRLVQPGAITPCDLVLEDDLVEAILPMGEAGPSLTGIDGDGHYLSHGFIDIHCHGGGGADFMDGTEQSWRTAARLHLCHGTTCITPTTLSATQEELMRAFGIFYRCRDDIQDGARMLGLHLEGPYFSHAQAGAQDPAHMRDPDAAEAAEMLEKCPDILRWSLAPELPGALEMGRALKNKGVLPAIGHSDATYAEVQAALGAGFTHVTHLYSGCSTITRVGGFRRGGIVEAAYVLDGLTSEIIADGCHLPPELLQMAYRFIGPKRLCLITDAMRGAGQTSGESILGSLENGQRCIIEDGVAKMPDRKAFAGSVCTTDRLVRNMVQLAGATLPDAIEMITATPARVLGLEDTTGTVAPGRKADLVLFDENIHILKVWTDGIVRYESQEELC